MLYRIKRSRYRLWVTRKRLSQNTSILEINWFCSVIKTNIKVKKYIRTSSGAYASDRNKNQRQFCFIAAYATISMNYVQLLTIGLKWHEEERRMLWIKLICIIIWNKICFKE